MQAQRNWIDFEALWWCSDILLNEDIQIFCWNSLALITFVRVFFFLWIIHWSLFLQHKKRNVLVNVNALIYVIEYFFSWCRCSFHHVYRCVFIAIWRMCCVMDVACLASCLLPVLRCAFIFLIWGWFVKVCFVWITRWLIWYHVLYPVLNCLFYDTLRDCSAVD